MEPLVQAPQLGAGSKAAGSKEQVLVQHLVQVEVREGDGLASKPRSLSQECLQTGKGGGQLLQVGRLHGGKGWVVEEGYSGVPRIELG